MRKEDLHDIRKIEGLLKNKLRPVTPNSSFVDELRERLRAIPIKEERENNSFDYVLWLAVGIGSSFLLINAGMRAVLSFASAMGIVHFLKGRLDEKQLSTQRTVNHSQ